MTDFPYADDFEEKVNAQIAKDSIVRWEYLDFSIDTSKERIDTVLNKIGSEGWELVSILRGHHSWQFDVIFKRKLRQ